MVRYPVHPVTGRTSHIPYDWEILQSFFSANDIVPVWTNCHYTWGLYDEESGRWTGAVGKVRRYDLSCLQKYSFKIENDEADMAVEGFACTYARTKVALCLPGVAYYPRYWHTRYYAKILNTLFSNL